MKKEIVNDIEVIDATTPTQKKTIGCDAFTMILTQVQDVSKIVVKESNNGIIFSNAPKESYVVKMYPGNVAAFGYIGNKRFAYASGDSASYTGTQIILRSGLTHQPIESDQPVAEEKKQTVQNVKRTAARLN